MVTTGSWSRNAFVCLLLLALVVPLIPAGSALVVVKHPVYLGLAVLGLLCLWVAALRRETMPAFGTPTDGAVFAFVLTAAPAVLMASNPGLARYSVGLVLAQLLTYVLAVKTVRTRRHVDLLFLAALLTSLVIAVLGLVGYARFVADGASELSRSTYLATPLFPHSYLAAQYVVMVFAGGLVLVLERGLSRTARACIAIALLPIGTYLLVTGSRGAYLAIVVALATHIVLRARSARTGWRARILRALRHTVLFVLALGLIVLLAAVTGALPGAASYAAGRLVLFFDPTAIDLNFSRLSVWWHTIRMAADHPILGVGLGCYDSVLPAYHYSPKPIPHAHNQFLHLLAERGLVGLIAFLFLVRHAAAAARRGGWHLESDVDRRVLFHASVTALVAALAYFFFETPLQWAEAGGLVLILLAVMSRAGCSSRDRISRPLLAHAGLVLVCACLGMTLPTWVTYQRSMKSTQHHLQLVQAADQATAQGDEAGATAALEQSLVQLDRADEAFPYRADLLDMRARVLVRLGRLDEAMAAYKTADSRQPGTFQHLNALGLLAMQRHRAGEAVDFLRRAVMAHRGLMSAQSYAFLGNALLRSGRFEEAWLVSQDLITIHHYDEVYPLLLLDAAQALIALDRTHDIGLRLVRDYLEREPEGDVKRALRLTEQLQRLKRRPRRNIERRP